MTNTVCNISDDILEDNYKKFVKVLKKHALNKDFENITNNDIIKDLLNTELNLFIGVEVTIQSICAAAVKLSVESDVESLVSRYEKHLKVDRQMEEENAEHEMEISENGPLLHHADNIIERAMNKYWRESSANGRWHFVSRKGELGLNKSKVLRRLKKQKSKLAFMDK